MESSRQIEERAAQWLAKRHGDAWTMRDAAELEAWLAQSTSHAVAFVRLEAAWNQTRRLKALGAGTSRGEVPPVGQWLEVSGGRAGTTLRGDARAAACAAPRRVHGRWPVAAGIVAAVATALTLLFWHPGSTYRTPIGGIAWVPMSDGSKVTLNTDSEIRLAVTDTERRVELARGEAFFEVVRDPNRPFVVTAGRKRVIAVGTQFSVRRDGSDVRVFITEGAVRIADTTEQPVARHGTAVAGPLTLAAGRMARASDAGVLVQRATIPEIETYLSWRTGHLVFQDMPLAEAIAEFNRYNARQIVIEDPAVAAIRLSGKFRATQFEAFVRLLEEGFAVQARAVGDRIVLTGTRGAEPSGNEG